MPTAAAETPVDTAAADPPFGVNMSFYSANDTLVNSAATQKLLRDKGIPLVRVPLRGTFDGNPTPIGDDLLLKVMRAAKNTGATPVLILRGPAAGDDAFVLRENLRRIDLATQVFGDARVYLEFGNESDLAGIDADEYARTWNAVVPELRERAPEEYRFVGPVNFEADADYVGTFVRLAEDNPPAYLSWHEYVCDKANESWDACLADIPKWATHVQNIENEVQEAIGRTLPFFISEWNVDPNFPSPAYSDAPKIKEWTTRAIAQLRNLGPLFAGAMSYTATDHGDFALLKGETTLTHQGEAFFAALGGGTPPPIDVRFDFEDGTTQGWSELYGDANPRNTTDIAQHGTHALLLDADPNGHAAVGTTRGLTGLRSGTSVTYQVWADHDLTVRPFVRDPQSRPVFPAGAEHRLPARQWVTVTWQVPAVSAVGAIGLEVAPGAGTIALDALTW